MNKILLVVNSDIGRKNTIGFRFGKIAEVLQRQNIPFEIIARSNLSKNFRVKTPFYKNYLARFLNAVRIYFFSNFDFRPIDIRLFDNFVLKNLKKSKSNFSLAHFGEYLPKSIGYLKTKNTKILLDIPIAHYQYALYLEKQGFSWDTKIEKTNYFLDTAIREADLLIVPSLFVKQSLEMAGFKKPMEIVPFGADSPQGFRERDIEIRPLKPIRFIFAGNVNYRKGINFLLEAWDKANLENAELLICGRVYKSIKNEIRKYKNKRVKFLGFVDVDKYFKESHIFVFPTLLEGSAKAVYEAMSYGLPVITTFNAGSIVEDGKSGFIIPIGDSTALREKMLYFYQNPTQISKMGKNAFERVKEYSWGRYGKKIVGIYQEFL